MGACMCVCVLCQKACSHEWHSHLSLYELQLVCITMFGLSVSSHVSSVIESSPSSVERKNRSLHIHILGTCVLWDLYSHSPIHYTSSAARGLIKTEIFYIYYTTRMCMTVSNEIFSSLFSYIISTQYSSKNIFTLVSVLIISRVQILSIILFVTFIFLFFYFFYVLPLCIISFM